MERYEFYCSRCKEKTKFRSILVSMRYGIKLECIKCGKQIRKNLEDLENV